MYDMTWVLFYPELIELHLDISLLNNHFNCLYSARIIHCLLYVHVKVILDLQECLLN